MNGVRRVEDAGVSTGHTDKRASHAEPARECASQMLAEYDSRVAEGLYPAIEGHQRAHLADLLAIAWLLGGRWMLGQIEPPPAKVTLLTDEQQVGGAK